MKYAPPLLCALIGLWVWFSDQPDAPTPLTISGPTMGTTYSITLAQSPASATELARDLQTLLDCFEKKLSTYHPDSELSRFNESRDDDWFAVSDAAARVLAEAQAISHLTTGAFDVTIAPLVNLWGFGIKRHSAIPTNETIAAARQSVGHQFLDVRLSPPALRKTTPRLTVDVNGIAPGYAVDLLAHKLDTMGYRDYLIELGGELRARGQSHLGRPWRVGIESPVANVRKIQRTIELRARALATSGDYRKFFEQDGRHYSHTIDPRTGRPVANALASVSVVADSCARADALATALMVLGPNEGFEFAERERLAALFIVRGDRGYEEKSTSTFPLGTESGRE